MSPLNSCFFVVFVTTIFSLLITVSQVNGLKCIQCMSYNNQDSACYYGHVEPTECPDANQIFCISYSGHLEGMSSLLVIRNCSSNNMSIGCQPVSMDRILNTSSPGRGNMKVCFYSCITDGCNNDVHIANDAVSTRRSMNLPLLVAVLVLIAVIGSQHETDVRPVSL